MLLFLPRPDATRHRPARRAAPPLALHTPSQRRRALWDSEARHPSSRNHDYALVFIERALQVVGVNMLKSIVSQSWRSGAHMLREGSSAPTALLTFWSQFHSGQVLSSSRSFFGVEDFVDEDNSRPYTYKKEKRSKNPHKHISFKQRTIAYMEPFTLDVFISKRFVSASLTHRSTCRQVAVAGTNSKDIKAALKSRSDIPACLAVGRFLAERAKEADVYTCTYTPRERDKFEGKITAVVQSRIDNGINVKLYLD